MPEKEATMTAEELLNRIEEVVASGGEVRVFAIDPLNPRCGVQVVAENAYGKACADHSPTDGTRPSCRIALGRCLSGPLRGVVGG